MRLTCGLAVVLVGAGLAPRLAILAWRPHELQSVVAPAQAGVPVADGQRDVSGAGAISGEVLDVTTGRPVPGAIVELDRSDRPFQPGPRVLTDSRGRFVFVSLPPAKSYYLGARRFGYEYSRYGWAKPGGPIAPELAQTLALADGQWIDRVKILLWKLASIEGRVVDERQEPVVGTVVRAFSDAMVAGHKQLVGGPMAVTDDRGSYRLAGLNPGRYIVAALSVQSTALDSTPEGSPQRPVGALIDGGLRPGAGATLSGLGISAASPYRLVVSNFPTPPPTSDRTGRRAYRAVFYPNATSAQDATPVVVSFGDAQSNVDFVLTPVSAFRVAGRMVGANQPYPPLLLRLLPEGSEDLGFGSEAATTPLGPDGAFAFLNVPQGTYVLLAKASVMDFSSGGRSFLPDAPGFSSGSYSVGSLEGTPGLGYMNRFGTPSTVWARLQVAVGSADSDDLQVPVRPASSVKGHVLFDGVEAIPTLVVLRVEPAGGNPSLAVPTVTARREDGFKFSLQGLLDGRYLLRTSSQLRVLSVSWQGRDITELGVDSTSGESAEVVVTLTGKSAEVSGVVRTGGFSGPVAVVAFPADRQRWTNYGWSPRLFATTQAGANGAYRLARLSEGEYLLIAVEAAQVNMWTDPTALGLVAPSATRLSLTWGDRKVQDVSLSKVISK